MNYKCGDCQHFKAFYLKVYCSFIYSDCGYCWILHSVKQQNDYCEKWEPLVPAKFNNTKYIKVLEGTLTRLSGIATILSELTEELTDNKE